MARLLEHLFNLRREELGRSLLLFFYLFLVIATYVIGKVVRSALFLGQFAAVKLPYFILIIALLTGVVIAGYVRISRRASQRNLLLGSLFFFASNCVLFWWLAHAYRQPWLYPVIYVWVGIVFVLAPAQVWTLANYVLTTREAKRAFGLVGSGAIAGWIFGGFFSKAAHQLYGKRYGTEILLLGMAFFLLVCAMLVVVICRQRQVAEAVREDPDEQPGEPPKQSIWQSMELVSSSPYLKAIAAVICLSSVATTFAGWQFDAIAQKNLVTEERLASFYASFYLYGALASLATQLFLTSRVLRRFGIGLALFVVPVALLLGSGGVLIWGTLAAAVILKGSDQVLRYSIDRSSVELLYLPVVAEIKVQVKSFIDTVIWRFGDGLAAIAVLAFATYLGWSPVRVSWVNIVLICGWIAAALVARRQYVAQLRECIVQHRLDAQRASAPVLDRATAEIFAANLTAAEPKDILYALSLFEVVRRQAAHPGVRALLEHPAPEVRRKAIALLAAAGDRAVRPQIELMLQDPHLEVRTEALLFLTHHAHIDPLVRIQQLGDFPDFSIRAAIAAFLSRPGETQNLDAARVILDGMAKESGMEGQPTRREAARLIGELPDEFGGQHWLLLNDADREVVREAIRAVGKLKKRRFVPRVIEKLADPLLAQDIVETLAQFGDRIVGTLRDNLGDPDVPIEIRREIPGALVRIGAQSGERVLLENLFETDTMLRFRIIAALNKLHQRYPELELDRQMVETVLAAEILGHYRSYQFLGTLGGDLEADDPVIRGLRESMDQEVERIFRLLSLLFPQYDFHSAYFSLQSSNRVVHDNALEFLDTVLKPQLRNVLVPLLDSEVGVSERVRLANRLVGAKVESREEAVAALVASDDPWLKSCGAYAIGTLGLRALERALDDCLSHPDPLLRETARQAKQRLAAMPVPAA